VAGANAGRPERRAVSGGIPRATQIITSSGQSGPEPAIRPGITVRQMLSVLPPPGMRGAGRWGSGRSGAISVGVISAQRPRQALPALREGRVPGTAQGPPTLVPSCYDSLHCV
jgi:hypothetical protein